MRFHKAIFAATALLLGGATIAVAATQGTVGATSSGTVNLSLTIPKLVRIFGLTDIALGTYGGTGDVTGSETFCVHNNASAGTYKIRATSTNGTGTDFRLKSGSDFIVYDVTFDDSTTPAGGTNLDNAVEATGPYSGTKYTGAGLGTCSAANASIEVKALEAALQDANPGAYTDTLTLLVTPL